MDAAAGRAAPHLLEPLKSASYSSPSPRVKRTHAANQMKSVQRVEGSLAQSGAAAVRLPLIGLGQVFVVPECPLPCQAHPHRESNEERPESQWLFGAVWGAAAVRPPLIGLGQVFVIPECPLPRQAHLHRESNEESPESRRLFGAVWGAAAVRLPPFAPAFSPRKAFQSQCGYAKAHKSRAADSVPRPPSGSPPENTQSRSKPTKPDNHTTSENALLAIPAHGGIGTQHFASRPVWRSGGKRQA